MILRSVIALVTLAPLASGRLLIPLSRSNFDDILKANERVLVAYYRSSSSTDEYLDVARPHFLKAATELSKLDIDVQLVDFDVDKDPEWPVFRDYKNMKAGPFIRYYCQGQVAPSLWSETQAWVYFSATYEPQLLIDWMVKQPCPVTHNIADASQLEQLRSEHDVVLLGLFRDENDFAAGVFRDAIERTLRDNFAVVSAVSTSAQVRRKYDAADDSAAVAVLKLFRRYEEGSTAVLNLTSAINSSSVYSFIRLASAPLVVELTDAKVMQGAIFSKSVDKHLVIFYSGKNNDSQRIVNEARAASIHFPQVVFVSADVDKHGFVGPLFDMFGNGPLPLVRFIQLIQHNNNDSHWTEDFLRFKPDTQETTAAAITDFMRCVLDGRIEPFRIWQPLPDDWNDALIKVLTAQNHLEFVMKRKTHVMVFYYSPSVPLHAECIKAYEQLALNHAHDPRVSFAKMDVYKNEVVQVRGPTIRFFKKEHHQHEDLNPYLYLSNSNSNKSLLRRLEMFYSDFITKWKSVKWNDIYDDTVRRVEF